jgi:hypothetical protein
MDGGTREIGGKTYFIFGLETIAKLHSWKDETPFFHHELFHVYHDQFFVKGPQLYRFLWREGLATFVSRALNPKASMPELLLDIPHGLLDSCEGRLPDSLKRLSERLESVARSDYTDYLTMKPRASGVPPRVGYCLGYLIASDVVGRLGLERAIRLSGKALLAEMKTAIVKIKNRKEATRIESLPPGSFELLLHQ